MASPESLKNVISSQKFQKENIPVFQSALSFVSVMGTRLQTSKDLEGSVVQNHEPKYASMIKSMNSEQQNEIEYFQFVSSPPRIKKIMSCNVSKTDRGKTLHNHLLCERFEMHMANHLQRSKSEILQKSYSTGTVEEILYQRRPSSSGAAINSDSMKSPKSHNPAKTSNSIGNTPPTSPEPNGSLSQPEAFTSDFGRTSAAGEESSFGLVVPERKFHLLDRENRSLTAEEKQTVDHSSSKDQKYLQSLKDRLNLLPAGENNGQKEKLKTFSGNRAKDLSALNFYEAMVNEQDTDSHAEQKNVILASTSNFKAGKSLKQDPNVSQAEKETSQDSQLKISQNEFRDGSSYASRQVSKKEKKTRHISSTLKEAKTEDHYERDHNPEPNPDRNENEDNSPVDKDDGSQVNLEKTKLPPLSQKELQNRKKKSLKQKLGTLNRPDIQNLLKPLPRHGHKQYFDPQEMAERRRQKLLEKMNQKKLPLDDALPAGQPFFEDYGWLAKYCIFNKDNWKIYGHTFETADTENKGWLTPKETMAALRIANSQLTPSEEEYLCRIIEMTGYTVEEGSDVRLFSILAALSHRITSLDNWLKSVLDNIDYHQLDMKTFKCKTLWECNVDPETNKISLEQLCVELRVGGVSLAHEQEVKGRLLHLKALDLLDFLTYIPLFIMIHESVVDNPLDFSRQK